jgi:pyruvate dehydrogenase E2 component (dihydrolipoamide acetyltransferase)
MSVNIEMPKLSDTMTEGTVVKWLKQVGDQVEIGDVVAEVETDKATMEMEAFDDGVLTEIRVLAGEKAAIGATLAVLNGDSGRAPDEAHLHVVADGVPPTSLPASAAAKPVVAALPVANNSGDRVLASPLARKVAAELGVDLATVTGSGPAGRITRSDVEAATKTAAKPAASSEASAATALAAAVKAKATAAPAPLPVAATPAPKAILPVAKSGDEKIELSTMRKVIASRLLTSKTTIPHFYLHVEVDAGPLMALR